MKKDEIVTVGKVVLSQLMTSRIVRIANSDPRTDKLEVTKGITLDKVREVSGWDGDVEKAGSILLEAAPDLKKEVSDIFQAALDNRVAYLERGSKSASHAEF